MKITATNGKFKSDIWLPTHPFSIRDELDKLRADKDTQLRIKITKCYEVKALSDFELTADLYKMNILAELIGQNADKEPTKNIQMAALLQVDPERTVDELIRMTFSDSVSVYPCSGYAALGEMVIDNDMLSELEDVPDNLLPMIDKEWVGRTFAERENGVFVDGYYCLPDEYKEPQIDVAFSARDDIFFNLTIAPPGKDRKNNGREFDLPVLDDSLEKFALEQGVPLDDMLCYSIERALPVQFEPKSVTALNNLAKWLSSLEEDEFVKLKAILQTLPDQNIVQTLDIAMDLNEYDLDREIHSYDDFGQKYLQKLLPPEFSARALDDTDLTDLGCNVLFMKGGTITTYGALSGKGQQLYTAIVDEPIQEETVDESEDESEGMGMGVIS